MIKIHKLENNVNVIYKKNVSEITSICIAIEAGAALEKEKLGVAHATEHMLYKGTKNRSENNINKELSEIFAFQNAMTNYPYVIYYGSLLQEDFEKGINLFSDILLNPIFSEEGFNEEIEVIKQELSEWNEDLEQFCEDKLFLNSFNCRLKYPIIGRIEDLNSISNKDIKEFYNKYYYNGKIAISIITNLEFDHVIDIINKYFAKWKAKENILIKDISEKPLEGLFKDYKEGINSNSRVEMIFSIGNLTNKEIGAFRIFNEYFGEGVNSILFTELRTKASLVYDVLTNISYEKHIGLYKICFNTSKENIDKAIEIINKIISDLPKLKEEEVATYIKRVKLKDAFKEEQGIVLAKKLVVDFIMEKNILIDDISSEEIFNVSKKVLKNPSIEVIINKGYSNE